MTLVMGRSGLKSFTPLPDALHCKVTTVTVERTLSVDQSRVDFGQLAVGTKAEV